MLKKLLMSKKLFVGNLPFSVADADLSELFSKAGTVVSATVIVDKYNNRSKGFGFVEMSTEEEAQKAIDTLNGKDIEGRNITVSEARPLEDRPKRESRDFRRR